MEEAEKIALPEPQELNALRELCLDFQSLLQSSSVQGVDAKVRAMEESVQLTLAQLDEFSALVESTRSSSHSVSSQFIERLHSQALCVESLFKRIDVFEAYLAELEPCIVGMERKVDSLSKVQGEGSLTGFLKSFVTRVVNDPDSAQGQEELVPPVVKASDYFE